MTVLQLEELREKESRIRNFMSNAFYYIINWDTGMKFAPGMTDYRLMKKQVAYAVAHLREAGFFIFLKNKHGW